MCLSSLLSTLRYKRPPLIHRSLQGVVYRRYYSHSPIPSDGDFNDVANRSESCQFDARISFNRFKFRFNDIQVIVAFDIAIALAIGQDLQSTLPPLVASHHLLPRLANLYAQVTLFH